MPNFSVSFLRYWFIQRRHNRRALRPWALLVFVERPPRGGGLRFVERQTGGDALDLLGVQHLAGEKRVGHLQQNLFAATEQRARALVVVGDEALHFLIDLEGRVLAVILVLRDLAAEEDLLFLLAEGERPHGVAHAPLAHHPACELGGALEVVAGAGGEAVQRYLL